MDLKRIYLKRLSHSFVQSTASKTPQDMEDDSTGEDQQESEEEDD